MKRYVYVALAVLVAGAFILLSACGEKPPIKVEKDYVVITATAERKGSAQTLRDYMDILVDAGELTYTMSSGMVTVMNGVKASGKRYWMLYTDDTEYAVPAWGTCLYQDKTYGSASSGAEMLPIKVGCTYIWHLQGV